MIDKEYELWNNYVPTQKESSVALGSHTSFEWNNSPRALIFTMVRYKFAMKLIGNIYEPNEKTILNSVRKIF